MVLSVRGRALATRGWEVSMPYIKEVVKLRLYHTIPTFHDPERQSLSKTLWEKGENAGNLHFSFPPTMFSIVSRTKFNFSVSFILSSANAFSSVKSNIVWLGTELRNPEGPFCVTSQ